MARQIRSFAVRISMRVNMQQLMTVGLALSVVIGALVIPGGGGGGVH